MRSSTKLCHVFLACFAVLAGCDEEREATPQMAAADPYIVAVNNPLRYFARRLIGDEVEVRLLAPAGTDPAAWRPSIDEVLQLQGAELILLNGAGYSNWLNKVSISSSKLVVTSGAVKDQWIKLEDQVTHSHGPRGEHAHGDYAFTTWMDLSIAQAQAESIAAALQQRWPQYRENIVKNLQDLSGEIDVLDESYRVQARRLAGRQIIYSHPVYQYFERRYQLHGHSLHWEPDTMPSDEQWRELQQMSGNNTLFVWEGEPSAAITDRMTTMGIEYVVVDSGANRSDTDWMSLQRQNVARLSRNHLSRN